MAEQTSRPTHRDGRTDATEASERPLAIDAEGLALTYSDGTEAVADLTLAVPEGECFGLLGANGAGKTTTIKMLATLLEPTAGSVRVDGHDVTAERTRVRASVGYMAQETGVDEELTARENLAFACDAYGVSRDDRDDRIAELLELVDLTDVADTPAVTFSGGMKKRLDAATALVHDPRLVFLDEPTTGLDPKARDRLWGYVQRINDRGTTVFLTTQYLEEADRLCDRIAVVRDGRVVADDSPTALKRRVGGERLEVAVAGGHDAVESAAAVVRDTTGVGDPASRVTAVEATDDAVRVTAPDASELGPDLLFALRDAGLSVTDFSVEEPTLDDVFFAVAAEATDALDAEANEEGDASTAEEAPRPPAEVEG